MEFKKCTLIICLAILLCFVFILFSENTEAKEYRSEVSFAKDPSYKLNKKLERDGKIVGWTYEIYIYFINEGNLQSDNLIVNITDEEGFTLKNSFRLDPGESKTITFIWSTMSEKDQDIFIKYFPEDPGKIHTKYNSGETTMKMIIEKEDTISAVSTPGFEIIIFIISVILTFYLTKRKKFI